MRTQKRGFTLVELLVVVAIISVLAALLLPSMQNAMEVARKTECANRMRQMMTLSHCYQNDFGVMLANTYTEYLGVRNPVTSFPKGWPQAISGLRVVYYTYPEINDAPANRGYSTAEYQAIDSQDRAKSLLMCPSGKLTGCTDEDALRWDAMLRGDTLDKSWAVWRGFGYSYDINPATCYASEQLYPYVNFVKPKRDFRYAPASKIIYWGERRAFNNWGYLVGFKTRLLTDTVTLASNPPVRIPHMNMTESNYACWDGHVASVGVDRFMLVKTSAEVPDVFPYQIEDKVF